MQGKFTGSKAKWLGRLLPLLLILGACATGTIREKMLTLPVIEGATYVGQETCAGCHEDKAASLEKNVHGRLADFELMGWQKGCESCHGSGSLHVDGGGDIAKINQPAKLASDQSAAICVACHSGGKVMDWTHSEHALADVGCTDCHTMHPQGKALKANLKKADPELCYDCHKEQMAKASFPSHHPVKEGKMNCSSCHNSHGELQTAEQLNDLCLNCHSRYQGPFVFEHAPVQEDCSICHDPHGTVANNLLKQNEPFLCLQCHESHFHTMRIGGDPSAPLDTLAFDGNILQGTQPTAGTAVDATNSVPFTNSHGADGWRLAFGTKCTVCHSVVHGSDLPSQSSPSIGTNGEGFPDGGKGLTR